jgi:glutamate-1-semialdehyde 2,1-aminomutase
MIEKKKSQELYYLANQLMPGPHANLRASSEIEPLFMSEGRGAHLWDVDGNEYIDYVCGYGPGILGYRNEAYLESLKRQLDSLCFLSTGDFRTTVEIELAQKFIQHVAAAEKVRFLLSGTETVQLAIRLARAHTGRRYFIRFEGHYHGWLDNVLGGVVDEDPVGRPFAKPDPTGYHATLGQDPDTIKQSFKLPWNDVTVLEDCLSHYGDEVAMILMEPIALNAACAMPRPGYLERVRELCDRHGIVLCFDEVQTGFRVGLHSAQGLVGVTPDLCTFGKALAGGLPLGAVTGRAEIMDLLMDRTVLGAGTFNGYPIGLAASLASITVLEKNNGAIYEQIAVRQNQLMRGIREIAGRVGVPVFLQGPTGVFFMLTAPLEEVWTPRDLLDVDWERQARFERLLRDEGILVIRNGRWFISAALTDSDVSRTLEAVETAMKIL